MWAQHRVSFSRVHPLLYFPLDNTNELSHPKVVFELGSWVSCSLLYYLVAQVIVFSFFLLPFCKTSWNISKVTPHSVFGFIKWTPPFAREFRFQTSKVSSLLSYTSFSSFPWLSQTAWWFTCYLFFFSLESMDKCQDNHQDKTIQKHLILQILINKIWC